jgi:O-6-methylguanine DNA methyltransferase
MKELLHHLGFDSPLGWIMLAATQQGICLLRFAGSEPLPESEAVTFLERHRPGSSAASGEATPLLLEAKEAILLYLKEGAQVPDLPLDMRVGTPFQCRVWKALCGIPYGETRSYSQVALIIGSVRSARAVGRACATNPIPIIVPCHRVVASNGRLGGYSGGLHVKTALLDLERMHK